jgi:putative hemin transport protein
MSTIEITAEPLEQLEHVREAYAEAREKGEKGLTRHRDIAATLGISEGELIAAHAGTGRRPGGLQARRLRPEWPRLIAVLEGVGEVMALTRNASCVHEKTGVYRGSSAMGPAGREMGLVLGEDIDLRLFYSRWAHGFAVDEVSAKGVQRSLQFFDTSGTAVHKVFARPDTDLEAWVGLVLDFFSKDQTPGMSARPAPAAEAEKSDADIDRATFHQEWASLRDTHDFFSLLKRHGLARTQALRLAERRFVRQVDPASAQQVLAGAAGNGTPVMVFVGNPGVIQIHTGPVAKVVVMGPWLNVLDPGFNLHLREDHIASAWLVRKPTSDGLVTSLELFDAAGETIAMLFGERKPGHAELCAWRELVDGLLGDRNGFEDAPCAG